jgi:AraC-like DNA-binding protein
MVSAMNDNLNELRRLVMRAENTWTDTGLPRVAMVQAEACADQLYPPMVHLVLQGSKTLSIGDQVSTYGPSSYFVVPVEVPGAPGLPYLALSLTLEPTVIAAVLADEVPPEESLGAQRFAALQATDELLDAWLRMLRLMDRPSEAAVLAPLIEREIVFRVLQGPLRSTLVQMARPDGRLAQIRRATAWIREHYTEPFRVEPLAAMTDMSVAAFYRHFKAATAMTPIQYQKHLRLLRARWLLLFDSLDAASIAFQVGYESASQFSREYARLFGLPPIKDAARFKV